MNASSTLRGTVALLVVAAFLAAGPAVPAHAGLGSLKDKLKKKAAEAGGTEDKSKDGDKGGQAAASGGDSLYSDHVLEMTPEVLARFEKGLEAQVAGRRALAKSIAALKTPEEYQKSYMEFVMSAEGQKVMQDAAAAASSQDPKTRQQAGEMMQSAVVQHCGHDPSDHSWQDAARKQIEDSGPRAAGMTGFQFSILSERMAPFFQAGGMKAPGGAAYHTAGSGGGINHVYSATEVGAMQAQGDSLQKLLKLTL